jgi:hypothetical protein
MPLTFTITREDMLRGKTVEPGWYKLYVKNVSQEPATTDGSTNTIIDFTVVEEGAFKDVPLRRYFSEKAPGFIVPFLVACGAKMGADGGTFNMENCRGKTIMGYIINEMYNNRPTNKVEDFRLLGTIAETPAQPLSAPK